MSERALRDELEALHAAILQERAKLAAPVHEELAQTRAALQTEIATLTERLTALFSKRAAREETSLMRQDETREALRELSDVRAEINDRQPLGDPLAESRSNWETAQPGGCAVGLLALLTGAGLAAEWWLR